MNLLIKLDSTGLAWSKKYGAEIKRRSKLIRIGKNKWVTSTEFKKLKK